MWSAGGHAGVGLLSTLLLGHFRRPGPAGETVDIEVSATGAGATAFHGVIPGRVPGRSSLGPKPHRGMSYARFPSTATVSISSSRAMWSV
jgi:hypothetical protein